MNGDELYKAVIDAKNNLIAIVDSITPQKGDEDKASPFSELSVTKISNMKLFLGDIESSTDQLKDVLEKEQLKELTEAAKRFGKKLVDAVPTKRKRKKKEVELTVKLTSSNILLAGKKMKAKDIFDKYKNASDIAGRKMKKPSFMKGLEIEVRHKRLILEGELYSLPAVEEETPATPS